MPPKGDKRVRNGDAQERHDEEAPKKSHKAANPAPGGELNTASASSGGEPKPPMSQAKVIAALLTGADPAGDVRDGIRAWASELQAYADKE